MEHTISCKVLDVIERTHDVKTIRLQPEKEFSYNAGQFVSVTLNGEKEFTRYLSLSSSPTEKGYIEVTKKITDSSFSQQLSNISKGQTIKISIAMGAFTLKEGMKRIACIAGGIGITPIRSLIKDICDNSKDIDVVLLYSNRTQDDIAFNDEFTQWQNTNKNLRVVNIVSEADESWCGHKGVICENFIKKEINDVQERFFYLCGPPGMVSFLQKMLEDEVLIQPEKIITEKLMGY